MFSKYIKKISPAALVTSGVLLLLLVAMAANSVHLPLIGFVENRLHDLRIAAFAPWVEEHPGIVILAYDEETLALSRQRSPLDRGILARALQVVDQAGAVAIGIDILLDQSSDPAKDQFLLESFTAMQTPVRLAYASAQSADGGLRLWQEEYLNTLFESLKDTNVQPARVALRSEADGTFRRTPGLRAEGPPAMAWALARLVDGTNYRSLEYIDYQRGPDGNGWPFLTLPIHLLAQAKGPAASMLASVLAGRIVLIGATLAQVDQHSTPLEFIDKKKMAGIGIHAHILAQILENRHPWQASKLQLWLIAAVAVLTGLISGMIPLSLVLRVVLTIGGLLILWGSAIGLQSYPPTAGSMLPLAGVTISWMLAYAIGNLLARAVVSEERRFVRDALSKYLPATVAEELERHPEKLVIGGQRMVITVLFTDIAGFTALSEQLEPEEISRHLNAYLDGMTNVIHSFGGTLDKYIGDAIVAFWGAPLPCEDGAQRAINCALQLDHFGNEFSQNLIQQGIAFGHTRIGIHTGQALVGNFGSGERFQYTAIGDTVNTAARLEGANKYLGSRILISEATVNNAGDSPCRPLGGLQLQGREQPIYVFEPVQHVLKNEIAKMMVAIQGLQSKDATAIHGLTDLAGKHPNDEVLQTLIDRIMENQGSIVFKLPGK